MHRAGYDTRKARACEQYLTLDLSSRLEVAGPHRLVAILYEELFLSMETIAAASRWGRPLSTHPQVERARTILLALESGLDFDAGGALAQSLSTVYRSMRRELNEVVLTEDPDALEALRAGVESLGSAWASLDA